jgi:hypothetical protein
VISLREFDVKQEDVLEKLMAMSRLTHGLKELLFVEMVSLKRVEHWLIYLGIGKAPDVRIACCGNALYKFGYSWN